MTRSLVLATCTLAFFTTACVTNIAPSRKENPPPREPLSFFSHFVLEPVTVSGGAGAVDPDALDKIQENINARIGGLLDSWNARGGTTHRTLTVTPTILALKFVDGGTRFLVGAYAGSSAVLMTMRLVDQQSGEEVANPEFFQRAAALGGSYSLGGTDNDMLARIAKIAAEYLRANYSQAVGGSTTGGPPDG